MCGPILRALLVTNVLLVITLGTPTNLYPAPAMIGTSGSASDLDSPHTAWDTPFCEIRPGGEGSYRGGCEGSGVVFDAPSPVMLSTPSGDGSAIRFALHDTPSYSNVLYRRKLSTFPQAAHAAYYELELSFMYRPNTTFNNQGEESLVQQIEFAMPIWRADSDGNFRVYDFEIAWQNVRTSPSLNPIWAVYSPPQGANDPLGTWIPTEVPARPTANTWHRIILRGAIDSNQPAYGGHAMRYISFTFDGVEHALNRSYRPLFRAWQVEQVANVHIQLDGPENIRKTCASPSCGYEVFLDGVTLRWSDASIVPTPTAPIAPSPTVSSQPTAPPGVVGGRNLILTTLGFSQVLVSWAPGSGQTGYRLTRGTAGGQTTSLLSANAVSTTDTIPTAALVCYLLEALGAGGAVVGLADPVCVISYNSVGPRPTAFALQLNQSNTAILSWTSVAGASSLALLPLGTSRLQLLPPNATAAVDDTDGAATCYALLIVANYVVTGFSDVICAIPGMSRWSG